MKQKKAHKTRRQIQAEKAATAAKLVQKANELLNPLESLISFHNYTSTNDRVIQLYSAQITHVPFEIMQLIFDLMNRNMKTMYEQSNWGWNEVTKQEELTDPTARFLIASCEGKMVGFSHFRFDLDNQIEVLYCYELQLEPSERRKGLGRFMMQALEAIAAKNQMQKVILTVFKFNPMALSFFCKLGYKVDITNPPPSEEVDYVILSKQNLTTS